MVLLWSSTQAIPWESHVDIPNGLPIKHFHGIPNEQHQCKSRESQCITQITIPWNSQCTIPIQAHSSHMVGIAHVLPIRHFHGALMEHYQCKSMGAPCGHPNDLPIEHCHGILNEQPQCKPMGSQCIAHRAMPWNSQ